MSPAPVPENSRSANGNHRHLRQITAIPSSATARIRSGEDPQRRGERTLLDRLAAQGLVQSALCSTAL